MTAFQHAPSHAASRGGRAVGAWPVDPMGVNARGAAMSGLIQSRAGS